MPQDLIPALKRHMQTDLCESEASLIYLVSSKTARSVTQRNPVLKKKKWKKERRL